MNRLGTLERAIAGQRREQLRAVLDRSLFPAVVYRRNAMLILRAERLKPLPRPLPSITVRWGSPADEPFLQRLRPRGEGYGHHFAAGRLLILGESGEGEPISCNWVDLGGVHVSRPNGYRFRFGRGAAWIFGAEVAPRFRFAGGFHKHFAEALRLLAERGVTRVYGSVQLDNPPSVNAHLRLGFEPLWRFRVLRLLGLIWHEARPAEGRAFAVDRGFGRWDGHDPETR